MTSLIKATDIYRFVDAGEIMRILQVHKDFEPWKGGGGTARHIHGLSTVLAQRGCEVRVCSIRPEIVNMPYSSVHAGSMTLFNSIRWADIVHVHGARSKYAFGAALMSVFCKKPFLYTPHAYYQGRGALNSIVKAVWDRVAESFFLNRGFRTILLTDSWTKFFDDRKISTARTIILPNCVLEASLIVPPCKADVPRLEGVPAILTVGRLDPVKRVADTIRAMADDRLKDAHFHIVGSGAERPALESLAQALGVDKQVTFHGFIDDQGVSKMMAGSDVFVLASEQEGLPTVLLEMLLAGVPVICTQIPGNLAITNTAGTKATYPVGDISALAELLSRSASLAVGSDAKNALRKEFTWEKKAMEFMELYRSAAAHNQAKI